MTEPLPTSAPAEVSARARRWEQATGNARPVPHARLRGEPLLVDMSEGLVPEYREVETAVLELSFDYGDRRLAASDPSDTVDGVRLRDFAAEARARQLVEQFGAVEIEALDDRAALPDSQVDYVVDPDGELDALCAFSASAVPKLRAAGWVVEIADDYPCSVVTTTQWFADVEAREDTDWFELQLGVEVDGRRIDLLPALVEMLRACRSAKALLAKLQRARRPVPVPLAERTYLAVPPERLQGVLRVFAELYEIEGAGLTGPLRVPRLVPCFLGDLEEELGADALTLRGDPGAVARSRSLTGREPPPRVDAPPQLKATLRPYQQQGLDWLQNLRAHGVGGVLADDMGLGKTLQTIAHIVTEKAAGRLQHPVLVVAPKSLLGNWRREIKRFAPCLHVEPYHGGSRHRRRHVLSGADVVLTSYPILSRDLEHFEGLRFAMLVLDEAQTVKNPRSGVHKAVKSIDAEHHVCLSGTPIENNLEELWALFDIALPGLLGGMAQFRQNFRVPIETKGDSDKLAVLRKRVAPFVLRRMKETVATELPTKTEIVRTVALGGEQRDLYEAIRLAAHAEVRRVVRKKGLAGSTIDILGALMKLRQVCCDPRLVSVDAAQAVEISAKLEALLEMIAEMRERGRRILIFSQFTSMLAIIAERLRDAGVRYVSLTGATQDRQRRVDAFQNGEAEVFLISLKAGGTGLNLTRADTVIHFDPWWNPQAQAQATDRAYRIGQQNPVFVYNLIVEGSVEERMLALQQRKRELANGLLAPGEAVELSERDVDDLFAPLS